MTTQPSTPLTIALSEEGLRILAKLQQAWTETDDEGDGRLTIYVPDYTTIIETALRECKYRRERPISMSSSLSPSASPSPSKEAEPEPEQPNLPQHGPDAYPHQTIP